MKSLQVLHAHTRGRPGPRRWASMEGGLTGRGTGNPHSRRRHLRNGLVLAARRSTPRGMIHGVLAVTALALAGCDALTLSREPEVAHLELTSTDVSSITLVTSQWYIEVESPDCLTPGSPDCPRLTQLVVSDTTTVNLPFQRSYPFGSRLQFYAEAYTTPAVDATVSMKVDLDDREWYNDSRRLRAVDDDGLQETIKFQYQYTVLRVQ